MKRKEHGLLFKAPMILALKNTAEDVWPAVAVDAALPWKWQTRRLMDPQPEIRGDFVYGLAHGAGLGFFLKEPCTVEPCPHPVGTIVFAKETFKINPFNQCVYRANEPLNKAERVDHAFGPWKPSIFMPKAAARLWFEVMDVRVERVNTISEADANAEGCPSRMSCQTLNPACNDYAELWDSINGKGDFAKGKWVWVYALRRISQKELARLRAQA